MFGVVLWRDEQAHKAVIWCEDHGDLAFYAHTESDVALDLEAGDWIQFDVTMEKNQRFVHNPKVVSEGGYDDLADALSATNAAPAVPPHPEREHSTGQIIPFAPRLLVGRRDRDASVDAARGRVDQA